MGRPPKTKWTKAVQARAWEAWIEGYSVKAVALILRDEFPEDAGGLEYEACRTQMRNMGIFDVYPNKPGVRRKEYRAPKIRKFLELFKNGIGPAMIPFKEPERKPYYHAGKQKAPKPAPVKHQKIVVPPPKPVRKRGPHCDDWDWFELLSPLSRRRAEVVREYQRSGGTELLTTAEIDAILAERDKQAA